MKVLKQLITKKNIAVLVSPLAMLLFWLLPGALYSYLGSRGCDLNPVCNTLFSQAGSYMFIVVIMSWPTLLVSIPAYFMREEVHSFWFKWMMCIYMPIACLITFFVARIPDHGNDYLGGGGLLILLTITALSLLFLILSVILIVARYAMLKKNH